MGSITISNGYASRIWISWLFGCTSKKGVRYGKFAGQKFYYVYILYMFIKEISCQILFASSIKIVMAPNFYNVSSNDARKKGGISHP